MDQWWWDNTTWPRFYLYCNTCFPQDLSWSLSFNLGSWCRKWWVCLVDISLVEGLNNVPLAICFHDKHVSLQFRFQNKINLACFIAAEAEISLVSPHIELINMVANTKSFTSSLCLWSSWVVSLWDTSTLLACLSGHTRFQKKWHQPVLRCTSVGLLNPTTEKTTITDRQYRHWHEGRQLNPCKQTFTVTYLTTVSFICPVWAGTYHVTGDHGSSVVIFRRVALHSVDHSHIDGHQDVGHFLSLLVCSAPSCHHAAGPSCRFFDGITQLKTLHRLGFLHRFAKLK